MFALDEKYESGKEDWGVNETMVTTENIHAREWLLAGINRKVCKVLQRPLPL